MLPNTLLFFQQLYFLLLEHDKRKHLVVSLGLVLVCQSLGATPIVAASLTLLIGLGKEIWDHFYGSGFCWYDMLANMLGILCGLSIGLLLAD